MLYVNEPSGDVVMQAGTTMLAQAGLLELTMKGDENPHKPFILVLRPCMYMAELERNTRSLKPSPETALMRALLVSSGVLHTWDMQMQTAPGVVGLVGMKELGPDGFAELMSDIMLWKNWWYWLMQTIGKLPEEPSGEDVVKLFAGGIVDIRENIGKVYDRMKDSDGLVTVVVPRIAGDLLTEEEGVKTCPACGHLMPLCICKPLEDLTLED